MITKVTKQYDEIGAVSGYSVEYPDTTLSVPNVPGNRHYAELQEWINGGGIVEEPAGPTIKEQLAALKTERTEGRYAPLSVTLSGVTYEVDMTKESQDNISYTIKNFDASRMEFVTLTSWPNDGTIPWVMHDDTVVPVTQADLVAIEEQGVKRVSRLHIQYREKKGALV